MTETLPVPLADSHGATITALQGKSNRVDVYVEQHTATVPVEAPDFVAALRKFFDGMDAEVDKYVNDPIATSQGLARMDALLADMRYVRDRLRDATAASMNRFGVRRLTVEGVTVAEASSSVERKNWRHGEIWTALREQQGLPGQVVNPETGELFDLDAWLTDWADALYGGSTAPRVTPMKGVGMDPADYCDIAYDEDGVTPIRKPEVRLMHNEIRRSR